MSSRITEKYGLPSILVSFDGSEDGEDPMDDGKGSGRSIKGLNLVEAMNHCEDLLVKYGDGSGQGGLQAGFRRGDARGGNDGGGIFEGQLFVHRLI